MYPFFSNQYPPQYPVYNPSPTPVQSNPRLICRQVGSIDEARNTIVDPMSVYVFVDAGAGKIYVKRMADNGQSEFFSYAQESRPLSPLDEIRQRLSNIEARLGGSDGKSVPDATAGGAGNEEPDAGNH